MERDVMKPDETFPVRGVRMPLDLWELIQEQIAAEDTDFSKWARRAFRRELEKTRYADARDS